MTGVVVVPPTIRPVSELFIGSASAFWATTYSLDLGLFNEFLLPRLGGSPLNAVVLADPRRLASALGRLPLERVNMLATVNSRWLLRSVGPSAGSFHPKSYLVVYGRQVRLLVGSGNLSTGGLDDGSEVFTEFHSNTADGDSAIAAWTLWMQRLVELVDDVTLADRFHDLVRRIPVPVDRSRSVASPLIHNLDGPIASRLLGVVTAEGGVPADEVLLAAPFYDADAEAVGTLLEYFQPKTVRVFVTRRTYVNGDRLAERLTESGARIEIVYFEPDRFVHAKLVGIISGQRGWVLSGSANLSRRGMTLAAAGGGNIELGVLAEMSSDEVRDTLIPPELDGVPGELDSLSSLRLDEEAESESLPVHLRTAAATTDRRVEVQCDPPAVSDWLLYDLANRQPLTIDATGRTITSGPMSGRLVQLVDAEGRILSNRVVVDAPSELAAILTASDSRPDEDKPAELFAGDLGTPLGGVLQYLHRHLVMDVTERVEKTPTGGLASAEIGEESGDDLWERLEHERLSRDPRAATYGRMWSRDGFTVAEPIIQLLEMLRDGAKTAPASIGRHLGLLGILLDEQATGSEDMDRPARRWTTSARIRVRALNVFRRWAAAQTDPRLMWIDPTAPVGNFAAIASVLATLRMERARDPDRVELTDADLDDIWLQWLRPFVGTGEGDGWLDQLDPDDLARALRRIPDWMPETAAALCWLALGRGPHWRARTITWQPVIAASMEWKLLIPTGWTAKYLTEVAGQTLSEAGIDRYLKEAVDFMDDALWCNHMAKELGLDTLVLKPLPRSTEIRARLVVSGIDRPLLDPRIPRLIVAARVYCGCNGVAVHSETGWRLSCVDGNAIVYKSAELDVGDDLRSSVDELSPGQLEKISGAGGVLASLFLSSHAA